MAFIQVSFMSKTLMRTVPLQVILPVDKFTFGQPEREEKPFKRCICCMAFLGMRQTGFMEPESKDGQRRKTLPLSCRPARMRFMWISRPSVPCTDSLSEKNWLRLQEKCFRCPEKEKTPLSEAFPWVVLAHSEMA